MLTRLQWRRRIFRQPAQRRGSDCQHSAQPVADTTVLVVAQEGDERLECGFRTHEAAELFRAVFQLDMEDVSRVHHGSFPSLQVSLIDPSNDFIEGSVLRISIFKGMLAAPAEVATLLFCHRRLDRDLAVVPDP